MISTGALVWTSVRPLIRTFSTVGAGFALTKADLFPVEAARGAAQIVLNIAMPCLLFSRIVPSFTPQNINALGPLTVAGLLYGVLGSVMAWMIKQVFWVPHRFRYGIIAAGGWGNYGDIPTAIVLGITASAPFDGIEDQNLAIAYVAALILIFYITLFPLGGFLIVAKDFDGPDIESDEVRERIRTRRIKLVAKITTYLRLFSFLHRSERVERPSDTEAPKSDPREKPEAPYDSRAPANAYEYGRHDIPSDAVDGKAVSKAPTVVSPTPTVVLDDIQHVPIVHFSDILPPTSSYRSPSRLRARAKRFMMELLKPTPLAILLAIPVALVSPLKALFVPPSAGFQPRFRPVAPDGQPPLAFVLDTATFVGAASVPIGLVCLGSALARLRVGAGEAFPRGAITALALGKMVITPVFGVGITQAFVHAGFIDRNDKVLQFVCILFSGLPTATTQVFLTQIYSPTGSAEHLSAFLIPQYVLMFFTMTALVTYTLNYLF
ncbi:auxin efflux carrier [Gloeopeniophorella convolvens]|nr:auxin efflux carrier [Gloeopeniophorella convolvens]